MVLLWSFRWDGLSPRTSGKTLRRPSDEPWSSLRTSLQPTARSTRRKDLERKTHTPCGQSARASSGDLLERRLPVGLGTRSGGLDVEVDGGGVAGAAFRRGEQVGP